MKKEKWILAAKRADFNALGKENGISPILARLLVNRGIDTNEKMNKYLHGSLHDLHEPWGLRDMDVAVELLMTAREEATKVAISSDFDCDGIFAGFILKKGLTKLGIECQIYTPERVAEGYGINQRIVDEAYEQGARLILTCDNGVAAIEPIAYAKSLDMTVIVTDHHEIQEQLPPADAVVDPKREDDTYAFDGLCGAGVAYKLILALYEKCGLPVNEADELIQYVAIATVADVMDLVDENRILVKEGLRRLSNTDNMGLQKLIKEQQLEGKKLRGYHIGFILGPCFNASGRLKTVDMAFSLLEETDSAKAALLAEELKQLNDKRKDMTVQETELAMEMLEAEGVDDVKVIVLCLLKCHESLVGIIAGRIKEEYHRPTIVFTRTEEGTLKGSGRSIESYDMFRELYQCKDLMLRFGGHKMAAGMTIEAKNLEELKQRLNQQCTLTSEDFMPVVNIDIPLPIGYISDVLLKELEEMEPLGKGNVKPMFAEQHFHILRAVKRGVDGQVLVMSVQNVQGTKMDAILFGRTEEFEAFIEEEYGMEGLKDMYQGKGDIDVAFTYYPSVNEYNGYRNFQVQISSYCRIQ